MAQPAPHVTTFETGFDVEEHTCPEPATCSGWTYGVAGDTDAHRAAAATAFTEHWQTRHEGTPA